MPKKTAIILLSIVTFWAVWAFASHHLPIRNPEWFLSSVAFWAVLVIPPVILLFVAVTVLRWCIQQWRD